MWHFNFHGSHNHVVFKAANENFNFKRGARKCESKHFSLVDAAKLRTQQLVTITSSDDERQSKKARAALGQAEMIVITLPALCELVWVLSRGYKIPLVEVAAALRRLMNSVNVVLNRPATEAGLAILEVGGDFADGVIAYEGRWLGAETFVSFDKQAVKLLEDQGEATRLLA